MAFADLLFLGSIAFLLNSGLKKSSAYEDERDNDYEKYVEKLKNNEGEFERKIRVNKVRDNTPCFFNDGLSSEKFDSIARHAGRQIKRIKEINIYGAKIFCNVESQTGRTDWDFYVDFNDWGHITGTYWTCSDNEDSNIPLRYGKLVSELVAGYLDKKGIFLPDYSDEVDKNTSLETPGGRQYKIKKKFIKRIFGKKGRELYLEWNTKDLICEHLYPVISMLKNNGFTNIVSCPIYDVDNNSTYYELEVEQIVIGETGYFEKGNIFLDNTQIIISYHDKRDISIPRSLCKFKGRNYIEVGDALQEMGFSNIYEKKIPDLVLGLIKKEGSVEQVLIGEYSEPIRPNTEYTYDEEIIITYHVKK